MNLEPHKQAEINVRTDKLFQHNESRKPFGFGPAYWAKWAVISNALANLNIQQDGKVLDIGCGAGWTSIFLAETGYEVTGVDIVPTNVTIGNARAKTKKLSAKFLLSDMEKLDIKEKFDAVLVFDSLHHTTRQEEVIKQISNHLKPGGWVLFGEPSYLHTLSPEARRVTREEGIIERGITLRSIKSDCRKHGLGNFERFFEGTNPYKSRVTGFAWQLIRLISANFFFAPQTSLWIAAQKKR